MAAVMTSSPPLASRVLSFTEDLWLKAVQAGTGVTVLGLKLTRGIDKETVTSAVLSSLSLHPVLGARITKSPKGKPELQIPNSISADEILSFLEVPADVAEGEGEKSVLHQLAERELNTQFPHVEEKGSSPVLQTPRHTAPPTLPPPITDCFPKGMKSKGTFSKILDGMGYVAKAQGCSLLPFVGEGSVCDSRKTQFLTQFVVLRFSASETKSVMDTCKANNCSLFAAEAAAALKATARVKNLGNKTENFQMTCIVGCRGGMEPAQEATSLGLFDAGVPLKQKVSEKLPFWDLAKGISDSVSADVSKRKHFSEMPLLDSLFSSVLGNPGLTPSGSFRTALLTAFVDAPMRVPWASSSSANLSADLSMTSAMVEGSLGPVASCHGVGPCVSIPDVIMPSGELEIY